MFSRINEKRIGMDKTKLRLLIGMILFNLLLIYCNNLYGYVSQELQVTYSVKDGLSNSTVKVICQDDKGYVWIGTKNGLNRFDGYEIKNYYHQSTPEVLQPNDIVSINKGSDGMFWIGTFSGVVLFDPVHEKFINIGDRYKGKEFPRSVVVGWCQDTQGTIWVATKKGLYRFSDGQCICMEAFRNLYIHAMAKGDDDSLILDIINRGVVLFDIHSSNYIPLVDNSGKRTPLFKIFKDNLGEIWLGGNLYDFYRYLPEKQAIERVPIQIGEEIPLNDNYIHDIIEYNDTTLMLATDKGVLLFDKKNTRLYADPEWTIPYRSMSIYKDYQGSLWVGTFSQGVLFYHPKFNGFTHYPLSAFDSRGNPAQVIGALIESQGYLWIGHSKGLGFMDMNNKNRIGSADFIPKGKQSTDLYYICQSADDELVFYLLNKGLFSLNLKTKVVKLLFHDLPTEAQVRAMAKDAEGRWWIAEDNLSYFNKGKLSRNLSTNNSGATRYMLTQDILRHNKDMVVGVRTNGVWLFRYKDEEEHYFEGERMPFKELKDKNISVLYEDSKGNIWIGTYDNGLYKCNLEQHTISHYEKNNGLVHNSICGILEERQSGDIWISAINGLSLIRKEGTVVNYTCQNGFPLDEVSRKAILQGSDGHIYIGGSNGLVEFDPDRFKEDKQDAPQVQLSLLETLTSSSSSDHVMINDFTDIEKVDLTYDNTSIRIKFSVLDYIYPKGYKYAYKLEGLDKEWNYIMNNEIIYSNLPVGKYRFCIKACNNEGTWSKAETYLSLDVHPPVWLTWWAKLVYILFIVAFFIILIRYFNEKRAVRYRQEIERIEKENIEKSYQMRIDLFTNFSHELRTPLTLITGPTDDMLEDLSLPEKFNFPMKQIQKNANRLLLLVNQLMDFRKLENGSMRLKVSCIHVPTFISEQIGSFNELLNKYELTILYTNDYYGNEWWADMNLMEKVMFNLISNAVKHSPRGGKIFLSSRVQDNSIVFSVKDCGEGISKENLGRIFDPFFQVEQGGRAQMFGSGIGLNLVRYVIKLHLGEIWVESELGKGTEFFIKLQLGKEHFEDMNVIFVGTVDKYNLEQEKKSVMPLEAEKTNVKIYESDNKLQQVLVVEDDDDMRQYIVSKLADTYAMIQAADGKQALTMAMKYVPDLVVSDVMMPVMDGVELCRAIKADMALAHIPVILLTAKSLDEHIMKGYEALADDYVLKPFNAHILRVKIESILKNRVQLKKLFSRKLESADVPMVELVEQDPFLEKLIQLIEERAEDPNLSVNDLCEAMNMGRSNFFKKIKAISDLSPNKLILNIRMKMAAEKLREGKLTISEVAYEVGFSNPTYFSKVFKSVFNQTPTEFIKGDG